MGRKLTMVVALSMVVVACGGSGSDDAGATATDDTQPASTTTSAAGTSGDSTPETTMATATTLDAGDAEGSGPSTATLTLGGETYDFSTEGALVAQCKTDLYGIFSVQLPMLDGDGSIQIVALREGTDAAVVEQTNAVSVSIGDEDWFADEANDLFASTDALQPGMSQVESVEIEGRTVRGTGTFVRQLSLFGGEPETTTGSFEATCGEERLS